MDDESYLNQFMCGLDPHGGPKGLTKTLGRGEGNKIKRDQRLAR